MFDIFLETLGALGMLFSIAAKFTPGKLLSAIHTRWLSLLRSR